MNSHLNKSFNVFFWRKSWNFLLFNNVRLQCKNDNLITVIHMKWIVYLQLNPALVAPCGSPPVSVPICCFNFCTDVNTANSSASFHWTFISIWPQAHSTHGEKMKPRQRRQKRSRQLLHLALNNLSVTLTVSITTLRTSALYSICWCDYALTERETFYCLRFFVVGNKTRPAALWGCDMS